MDAADLQPGQLFGRFRIESLVGEGATGIVFRSGELAVKVIRPERAGHGVARERFLREARLAATMQNRHLVPILEAGEIDGLAYLAMPYFEGGSLAERIAGGGLELAETADLAAQLGRGLDALHADGVLHRDVKPSNILLSGDLAALADFGLARAGDWTRLTREGQLLGTAQYLAPELIEGTDATPASDVYALGCVLYECVAGRPPFTGRDEAEIGFAHLTETPPDPGAFGEALLAALDKDPSARPTSATALARMLHLARTVPPA